MKARMVGAAACMALAMSCSRATPPSPTTPAEPAPPVLASVEPADLDRYIAAVVEANRAVGVNVGVMRNGEVVLAKGYGLANVERQSPVTPDTLFAIGSVTKQFTCSVALQLEQEGRLSFADPVAKYEPRLTRAGDITLRDLGNHVSGYRDYYPLDFVDRPMAADRPAGEVWRDFASRPLDFEPGSRYSYSNTGYLLLGHVAEVAGREPFAQALERRLLKPFGLAHTRFEPTRGEPGLADGYTPMGLGKVLPAVPEGRGWIDAAGGLWSTPSDLMTWDLALMDGKVLSSSSWKTMTTPRTLTDGRSSAYGCGQSIRDRGAVLVLAHSGGVSGFGARNAFIPASRSAVVVMANSDWSSGVLDAIQEAVLAKLMPAADAPSVAGPAAEEAALDMLRQIRAGQVDRSKLSDEYGAFLTAERLVAMQQSLVEAGEVARVDAGPIRERGGLEVSTLNLVIGTTPATTLMYRRPDGTIEEFLFYRR
ncbi:MAG: beta-lactamase family protein [Acidobacteriota bacterium]|nr:beta-lactamase family protein [Acidobacteriota bacterium]